MKNDNTHIKNINTSLMNTQNTRFANDEETRIILDKTKSNNPSAQATYGSSTSQSKPASLNSQSGSTQTRKSHSTGKAVAAGVGGFVAGAAVGGATMASAQSHEEVALTDEATTSGETNTPNETTTSEGAHSTDTPNPEEVILANDEGIRYAHVNADNFNDAFAQARAQVGAGGVFEYDGKLYGTYYADEWNEMTAEDRSAYQSRVNGIAPSPQNSHAHQSEPAHRSEPAHHANSYDMADNHQSASEAISTHAEVIEVEPTDNDIRVLGVEAVQSPDGQIMNVAILESNGDHALLVDVDNDGVMEVFVHDDNQNNHIEMNEMHDVSRAGIGVVDLLQAQSDYSGGDNLYMANDGTSDYYNDTDIMTADV